MENQYFLNLYNKYIETLTKDPDEVNLFHKKYIAPLYEKDFAAGDEMEKLFIEAMIAVGKRDFENGCMMMIKFFQDKQ